jgi:hypothetical protein
MEIISVTLHLSAAEAFFDIRSFSEGCGVGGPHRVPSTQNRVPRT